METTGTGAPPAPPVEPPKGPSISGNSPRPSSESGVAQPIDVDALTKSIASQIIQQLDPIIDSRLRSAKDKRLRALDDLAPSIETYKKFKDYLDASGGDVAKATREMQIDQLIASGGQVPGKDEEPGEQRMADERVTKLLEDLGLNQNDSVVLEWANKEFRSEDAAELALRRAVSKAKKQVVASTALPIFDGGPGAAPQTGPKQEQIDAAYAELDPLFNEPTKNAARIEAIKARIAKLESIPGR